MGTSKNQERGSRGDAESPKSFTLWSLRRRALNAQADDKGRHVGDLILRAENGTLRLHMLEQEFAVFRRDNEKQTEPGRTLWNVKAVRQRRNSDEKDFRTVGLLSLEEETGAGEARFDLFEGTFLLGRRDRKAADAESDDIGAEAA